MGGHTRRSKHAARTSSTVLCDSAASLEDWKEQIKVKGSIPANQKRLTFTSQRSIKQPFALANFSSNKQWQIIVNASAEEICEDLRHWRAILSSKNISAELLKPLVLKETDEFAAILHSKTAKQLRSIGVPCNVFFLSFDTWIPRLQSGVFAGQALPSEHQKGLDLKIDEEFCQNVFLIKLCGDLNGLRLPMPISFVLNGNELASKLSMVEQTAHYREKQRQRYCQYSSASALEDEMAESNQASVVNYGSSDMKDYILEFDQNYEFTTFISKDNHQLRCIVLPVITISLEYARDSSDIQSFLHLLRGYSAEAVEKLTSNVLALPSSSQSGEESALTARNITVEVPGFVSSECSSTQKASKKKKKKKAKKALKGNSLISANFEAAGNKATAQFSSSCEEAAAAILHVDIATVDDVKLSDPSDHEESNALHMGVVQSLPGSEPKDEDLGSGHPLQDASNAFVEETQEICSSIEQSSLVCHLPVHLDQNASEGPQPDSVKQSSLICHLPVHIDQNGSEGQQPDSVEQSSLSKPSSTQEIYPDKSTLDQREQSCLSAPSSVQEICSDKSALDQYDQSCFSTLSSTLEICPDKSVLDQYERVMDSSEVQEDMTSSDNASWLKDTPMSSTTSLIDGVMRTKPSFDADDSLSKGKLSVVNNTGELRVFKWKPFENQSRAAHRHYNRHHEVAADNTSTSFDHDNGRWEHHSNHRNSNRHNFWPRQGLEGQDHFSYRNRTNQDSFYRGSRSSAFSWRHQSNNLNNAMFHSWSRERFSRPDDEWLGQRGSRNIAAWEHLPNLRQPSSGSRFSNHWDNNRHNEFWSQGQNYGSFNVQQRKYGKNNKISQQYVDKRQLQQDSNDMVPSNVKALTVFPHISNIEPVQLSDAADQRVISEIGKCVENKGDVTMAPCSKDGRDVAEHGGIGGKGLQSNGDLAIASCRTVEETVSSLFGNDQLPSESERSDNQLSKVIQHVCNILDVVNMSCEASCVYEQSLNGKASCEFQKLAKAVAPALKASQRAQCWKHTCFSCRSLGAGSSNSRQVPDVQLSALWKWYEEPSCYGLKVNLSGCSERTRSSIQAFFVPYLSGVQLFGWPKRRSKGESKDKATAQEGSLFDSGFLSEPIFSILLPRPNSCNGLMTGVRQKTDIEFGTIQEHCHCDVELLFEFFEAEKPQQRKPLIDRIEELVSNHADANVLNTANVGELHPSSWFAVAWYPIYTIPDETFRSAFLTYHCLSSLQSDCSAIRHNSDKSVSTIIAPVAGLMSYNAQAKDWFTLSPPCTENASNLLQQYMGKLETAAASMSRGSSDNLSSVKHTDFLFFQSRGR